MLLIYFCFKEEAWKSKLFYLCIDRKPGIAILHDLCSLLERKLGRAILFIFVIEEAW